MTVDTSAHVRILSSQVSIFSFSAFTSLISISEYVDPVSNRVFVIVCSKFKNKVGTPIFGSRTEQAGVNSSVLFSFPIPLDSYRSAHPLL